ncbi:hypothetical protein CEXT_640261 [Caerostris extrusa]|uniref:Uncharacterized protein n=1 Tax=Caerostris extrusa TaxID=172846 RepID=A0AAV4QR23_CAEEX|nr:hypothetical protein CEXT_640261 [Caerostris extrusa]
MTLKTQSEPEKKKKKPKNVFSPVQLNQAKTKKTSPHTSSYGNITASEWLADQLFVGEQNNNKRKKHNLLLLFSFLKGGTDPDVTQVSLPAKDWRVWHSGR